MIKLILLLLLYDVHASKVKVLSNKGNTEEKLLMNVASGQTITDFTLCLRVLEHVYSNEILRLVILHPLFYLFLFFLLRKNGLSVLNSTVLTKKMGLLQ